MNLPQNTAHAFIRIPDAADERAILGPADENLRYLQDSFEAKIVVSGRDVSISGTQSDVDVLSSVFSDIISIAISGKEPDIQSISHAIDLCKAYEFSPQSLREDIVLTTSKHSIYPKTPGQKRYVDSIRENTITFGIGPAGTGKTYLAMAMAVSALQLKEVGRIILSRPILEAGENLGFLPGTLTEKVDPYIRPLYDALFDMMDAERAAKLLETGVIEVAPLAFMRGRTLNDSFIILDEAQNSTPEQMKMFLTRLGFGSKMVITGDLTQSDLPNRMSGLQQAQKVLGDVKDIQFCTFSGIDVVRNSLVSAIINAYEKHRG